MMYKVRIQARKHAPEQRIEATHPRIAGKKALKNWLNHNKPKHTIIGVSVYGAIDENGRTQYNQYNWRVRK